MGEALGNFGVCVKSTLHLQKEAFGFFGFLAREPFRNRVTSPGRLTGGRGVKENKYAPCQCQCQTAGGHTRSCSATEGD